MTDFGTGGIVNTTSVRIADKFTCGAHPAASSSNVDVTGDTGRNLGTRSHVDDESDCAPGPEDLAMFSRALQVMSPDDQAVLVAYYVYEYSTYDLAAAFGVSRRSAEERIYSALRRTREKLGLAQPKLSRSARNKQRRHSDLPRGMYRYQSRKTLMLGAQLYQGRRRIWSAARKETPEGLAELCDLLAQARKDHGQCYE